ncbi:MAG: hypothetical protein ACYCTB_05680 [bacterium]
MLRQKTLKKLDLRSQMANILEISVENITEHYADELQKFDSERKLLSKVKGKLIEFNRGSFINTKFIRTVSIDTFLTPDGRIWKVTLHMYHKGRKYYDTKNFATKQEALRIVKEVL